MTKELQTRFLEQLTTDSQLQENLTNSKTPEEAHKVVIAAGFNVEFDDFKTAMGQLNSLVNKESGELSENDLDMVAGGRDEESFLYGTATGIAVGGGMGVAALGAASAAA